MIYVVTIAVIAVAEGLMIWLALGLAKAAGRGEKRYDQYG